MFLRPCRHPASILFSGVVAGLVTHPYLISNDLAVVGASLATLLAIGLRGETRFLLCLMLASLTAGLVVAGRAEERHERARQIVRSLPADRFSIVRATIDEEWKPGRDGVFSRVWSFELVTPEGSVAIDEPLSIYAPGDTPGIGETDFIVIEGFLRESARGALYVSVKSRRLVTLTETRPWWHPRDWNRGLRSALERHVAAFPEHARAASLIRAIALGDGSALSSELREAYRRGGTYHLLVFSGMQIAFAATLIALLLRILRLRSVTDLSLVALALVAPPFAGNEPSISRASTMIGIYGLSRLIGRPTPMTNLLFLSAAIRLLARPEELSSPGLLLTYAATFGLVVVGHSLAEAVSHPFGKAIAYGVGAELCTQPLTLFFFRHFVAGGFAVTLLLSPLLGGILLLSIPIAIALATGSDLAWLLVEIVAMLDSLAILVNEFWSGMRLSGFAPAPPGWLVVLSFSASWLAATSRIRELPRTALVIVSLLLVPLTVWTFGHRARQEPPSFDFLDVGQGDATLIRSSRTMLVDGGGSPSDPEFGRRSLIPLLADRGVRALDVVVMSHPDIDHCGGLLSTAGNLTFAEVWISPRHLDAPCTMSLLAGLDGRTRLRFLRDGETILVGDIEVQVTLPRLRFKHNPLNNGSVVLTTRLSGIRAVLAGDIEREAETLIGDEAGGRLRGDILKVPHHGSRTSSSQQFLDVVKPRTAVISCGIDNRYGHPALEILTRYRRYPIQLLRTDLSGSIRIAVDEGCPSLWGGPGGPIKLTPAGTCF